MTIRTTAIKTIEAEAPRQTEAWNYIDHLISETMPLYRAGWRLQAADRFIEGMHNCSNTAARTYAYTSGLERKLTELVGRVHYQREFEALLIEVRERFTASA